MKAASLWCPFESTGTVRYSVTIATISKKEERLNGGNNSKEQRAKEEYWGRQLKAESSDFQ